jgi:hypothetical protein
MSGPLLDTKERKKERRKNCDPSPSHPRCTEKMRGGSEDKKPK